MPRRDPRTWLWDAREAVGHVQGFVRGKEFEDYATDLLLRSAVERQVGIVGEALARLREHAPAIAARVSHAAEIIALRNRLVHGYASIDDAVVWGIVIDDLDPLVGELTALLEESGPPPLPEEGA